MRQLRRALSHPNFLNARSRYSRVLFLAGDSIYASTSSRGTHVPRRRKQHVMVAPKQPPARVAVVEMRRDSRRENKLLRLRVFSLSPPPSLQRPNIRNLRPDYPALYQSQQIFACLFAAAGRESIYTMRCGAAGSRSRHQPLHQAYHAERSARCPLNAHYWRTRKERLGGPSYTHCVLISNSPNEHTPSLWNNLSTFLAHPLPSMGW